MNIRDLTRVFNRRFNDTKTEEAIKSALGNRGIICGRTHGNRFVTPRRLCTPEQDQFLKINYPEMSVIKLTIAINAEFGTRFTDEQIKTYVHNNKIPSGRTGQFKKGHINWNKGTKGICKPNSGSFKKGNTPGNLKPLGHERICSKDGFILIKIVEKNPYTGASTRYKHKHVYVWEQENGKTPEGMVIVFRDGIKLNCELDNLMLLSRAELLRINQKGYKDAPGELKPSILALARLEVKIFKHEKND